MAELQERMESSRENSKEEGELSVSKNSSQADHDKSSSNLDSDEEQPRLAAARVTEDCNLPSLSTLKISPPKISTSRQSYSASSRELHVKVETPKAAAQHRDSGARKLTDLGLDYSTLSSDTDQEVCRKLIFKLYANTCKT